MGLSTNACLHFGVNFGEEHPLSQVFPLFDIEELPEFDTFVAEFLGLTGTWRDAGYAIRKSELFAECPLDLGFHCSAEYPMYALVLKGKTVEARRGSPQIVELTSLSVSEEQISGFKQWSSRLGIDLPKEPSWLLMSYMY